MLKGEKKKEKKETQTNFRHAILPNRRKHCEKFMDLKIIIKKIERELFHPHQKLQLKKIP